MKIKNATFVVSNSDYRKCPELQKPEYAFIGRSNVGKSSLINKLVNEKDLAKTSQQPGKTQLINHFSINNDEWFLVDLPGYGWAKVSQTKRFEWGKMLKNYLMYRPNLFGVFALIDIRIKPQQIDLDFMEFLGENEIPFVMVFTKADKLSKTKAQTMVEEYQQKLLETWEETPKYFITSAEKGEGCSDILDFIETLNKDFQEMKKHEKLEKMEIEKIEYEKIEQEKIEQEKIETEK